MAKQTINLGTAPTGVGGDTPRSAFTKAQSNFDELYSKFVNLGLGEPVIVSSVNADTMQTFGFYYVTGSTMTPYPSGWLFVQPVSPAYCAQTFISELDGKRYTRTKRTTWDPWVYIAPAVGTVSQSGGTATGAIIEKGTGANGQFTKFADGTMICVRTVSLGSLVVSAQANGVAYLGLNGLAFAATFVDSPAVTMSVVNGGGLGWAAMGSAFPSLSATQNFFLMVPSVGTYSFNVQIIAIGRWF
ncbi:pyocin knob domain-containing protein [Pseudomonas sp. TMB3-21]